MTTLDELCDVMRSASNVRVVGTGSRSSFLPSWTGGSVTLRGLSGVIGHDVADHIVEVWAGTPVQELQEELAKHGQCIPLASHGGEVVSQSSGTAGGLVAMNLPHALTAQCGGPRDWVLGMTVVRTDGTVAKCGSKAVKSVAGYDVHKLMVGSRGTLAAIAKVVLRTFPTKSLPTGAVVLASSETPRYVMRTLRTDFEKARDEAKGLTASCAESCTLWSVERPEVPQYAWLVGPDGLTVRYVQPEKFERRAKDVFDPRGALAPGWS